MGRKDGRTVIIFSYQRENPRCADRTDRYIKESAEAYARERGIRLPEPLQVTRAAYGKPCLNCPELYVGVTHTERRTLVAIGEHTFGIDAESRKRTLRKPEQIIKKLFSEEEQAYVRAAGEDSREYQRRVLEIWVKKEAYVKYLGEGLRAIRRADTCSVPGCYQNASDGEAIIYLYMDDRTPESRVERRMGGAGEKE